MQRHRSGLVQAAASLRACYMSTDSYKPSIGITKPNAHSRHLFIATFVERLCVASSQWRHAELHALSVGASSQWRHAELHAQSVRFGNFLLLSVVAATSFTLVTIPLALLAFMMSTSKQNNRRFYLLPYTSLAKDIIVHSYRILINDYMLYNASQN